MDEFTSIAIWMLIIFLSINAAIVWFQDNDTGNYLGLVDVNASTEYTEADMNSAKTSFFGTDCSTVSPTDLAYAPCFLIQTGSMFSKITGTLWRFLTAWVNVLDIVLTGLPAGGLFKAVLIPFFALIEFAAIFVILRQIAGIIRGGS